LVAVCCSRNYKCHLHKGAEILHKFTFITRPERVTFSHTHTHTRTQAQFRSLAQAHMHSSGIYCASTPFCLNLLKYLCVEINTQHTVGRGGRMQGGQDGEARIGVRTATTTSVTSEVVNPIPPPPNLLAFPSYSSNTGLPGFVGKKRKTSRNFSNLKRILNSS